MKKYLSNSVIWGPLLSCLFFIITIAISISNPLVQGNRYVVLSVLVSLGLCAINIPASKDLDFIASSNRSIENYLATIIKRNLWYHLVCLIIATMIWIGVYETLTSMDTLIMGLLMVCNSIVVVGIRIRRYELITAYVVLLAVGALFSNSIFLILLGFIMIALSFDIYTRTVKERDLV